MKPWSLTLLPFHETCEILPALFSSCSCFPLLSLPTSGLLLCSWLIQLLQVWLSITLVQTEPFICILRLDSLLNIPRNCSTQAYANYWEIQVLTTSVPWQGENLSFSYIQIFKTEMGSLPAFFPFSHTLQPLITKPGQFYILNHTSNSSSFSFLIARPWLQASLSMPQDPKGHVYPRCARTFRVGGEKS